METPPVPRGRERDGPAAIDEHLGTPRQQEQQQQQQQQHLGPFWVEWWVAAGLVDVTTRRRRPPAGSCCCSLLLLVLGEQSAAAPVPVPVPAAVAAFHSPGVAARGSRDSDQAGAGGRHARRCGCVGFAVETAAFHKCTNGALDQHYD